MLKNEADGVNVHFRGKPVADLGGTCPPYTMYNGMNYDIREKTIFILGFDTISTLSTTNIN